MEQFKKSKYFLEEIEEGCILLFVSKGKQGYTIKIRRTFFENKFYILISSFRKKDHGFETSCLDANGEEWCEEYRFYENGCMYLNSVSLDDINKILSEDPFERITDVRKGANDVLREYFNKVVL